MSSVPFIGISSHFLTNDELTESRVCFTQVMFISNMVRSQLIFDIRNFEYSSILCFGWRGILSMSSSILLHFSTSDVL